MSLLDRSTEHRLAWGLILAVGVTRIPGLAGMPLPDASLAAFFIGGLCSSGSRPFGGLLVAALAADLIAVHSGLVPSGCLSAAYLFLVPTYGLVWAAGRASRRPLFGDRRRPGLAALYLVAAVVAAFILSNAAYYAFAIDAAALGGWEYAATVSRYFPSYAGDVSVYLVPALLVGLWREHARRAVAA